ncbi:hypothetical protein D4S03_03055 [bacterium]|nr:MAG: hypothetical protein D4S03_03055 [bacterium]
MERCIKCILPETFPGIKYNSRGVCNYCLEQPPVKVLGPEALRKELARYRNKGKEYDCIVPISGGRDSTFVLYKIVIKYKMRVLTLTVDSGFILPEGLRNIKVITQKLKVPHVWLRDEKKIKTAQENTRIKFQGWLKKPSINTIVPVLNSGDKTMNLQMARYAKDNGIPLIIGGNFVGNSSFEEEHWKRGFMGVFPDDRGRFTIGAKIKLVACYFLEFLKNPYNFKGSIISEYFTGGSVYFFEKLFRPKGIDFLGFFDYIYWNEKEIVKTVCDKLSWEGAADHTTTWRIDDSAYPLLNYLYYKLVGFTEHDEMYSKMIRENQLTREEGLKRCLADHDSLWINGTRVDASIENLGVTRQQVDQALERYRTKLLSKILEGR